MTELSLTPRNKTVILLAYNLQVPKKIIEISRTFIHTAPLNLEYESNSFQQYYN